jgi:hypothetical protein
MADKHRSQLLCFRATPVEALVIEKLTAEVQKIFPQFTRTDVIRELMTFTHSEAVNRALKHLGVREGGLSEMVETELVTRSIEKQHQGGGGNKKAGRGGLTLHDDD